MGSRVQDAQEYVCRVRKDEQAWTLEKMQHRKGDVLAVHRLAHTQRTLSVVAVR
jgi:hypothetical protein